ncbi:XTP/dITP diphosphatase [Alteribacillus sp. HJP-4]|uniref:XTP/dITP diphosphatase n=1 Tax=Alteribacillus sp. HJP-4 TaxID=2775394 RepID=UPI0035CCFC12
MNTIVIATKNEGKIREFRELLKGKAEVKSLLDIKMADIEETGVTFEENAALKAEAVMKTFGFPAAADDSGLEVDALQGGPGVYSARYAGPEKDDKANINKLLHELDGAPSEERTARFVCAIAVAVPDKETLVVRGTCEGRIAEAEKGTGGFGYDPVFFVPEKNKTMAELTPEEKNAISHRYEALKKLNYYWSDLFHG